jgi:DNA-directed RNA polymerase specialized sigma24 family protein
MMAKDRKFKEIVNDSEISRMKIVDDDAESLKDRIERDEVVLRTVSEMKPPCDSILKAHYWDKLSGTEIALKYGYSNADSVKTQKSKCIKKLRAVLEKILEF